MLHIPQWGQGPPPICIMLKQQDMLCTYDDIIRHRLSRRSASFGCTGMAGVSKALTDCEVEMKMWKIWPVNALLNCHSKVKGGLLVKALAGLFGPPPCYHTFNFIAHCTKSSKGNKLYLRCHYKLIFVQCVFSVNYVRAYYWNEPTNNSKQLNNSKKFRLLWFSLFIYSTEPINTTCFESCPN